MQVAHIVRVQPLLKFAGLKRADMRRREIPQPQAFNEREKVVATGPFVAKIRPLTNLVADGVRQPSVRWLRVKLISTLSRRSLLVSNPSRLMILAERTRLCLSATKRLTTNLPQVARSR